MPDAATDAMTVLGTGSALPGPAITTRALLSAVAPHLSVKQRALANRIAQRLAINTRHLARDLLDPVEALRAEDSGPRLASRSAIQALAQSKLRPDQLRFLIGHTATPHTLLPSNTAWTADELSYAGPHVELRQACTGFAAAAVLAQGLLCTNGAAIAVVGSETGSVFFDPRIVAEEPEQLVNLVQMGDGAGAIVLAAATDAAASRIERLFYGSCGLGRTPGLMLEQGGSAAPQVLRDGHVHFTHHHADIKASGMDLLRSSLNAAKSAGIECDVVDWYLPHQANGRMPELCAEFLQLPRERVICEASVVGNLGSAAIWVALDRLRRSGRLNIGDRVLVIGAEATKYMYGGFLYVHGNS